ncbi:MAG: 3'-5' exonuclease [Candidatus Rifleibacteriota bacterium]
MNFVAIDFETATGHRNSACSVGIVTVIDKKIVEAWHSLIQPPENAYWWQNTEIHGITPAMTRKSPTFAQIYPEIRKRLQGRLMVAHNESFDRGVLQKSMAHSGLDYRELELPERWECTVKIYRRLGFTSCRLNDCCQRMNIPLNHHEALSDALACANLFLRAAEMAEKS